MGPIRLLLLVFLGWPPSPAMQVHRTEGLAQLARPTMVEHAAGTRALSIEGPSYSQYARVKTVLEEPLNTDEGLATAHARLDVGSHAIPRNVPGPFLTSRPTCPLRC